MVSRDSACSLFSLYSFCSIVGVQEDATLPRLTVPHDVFRQGLGTLKDDIGNTHIVQAIQQSVRHMNV